jgi:hypothetical protein
MLRRLVDPLGHPRQQNSTERRGAPEFGSDGAGAKARKRTWIHVGLT